MLAHQVLLLARSQSRSHLLHEQAEQVGWETHPSKAGRQLEVVPQSGRQEIRAS